MAEKRDLGRYMVWWPLAMALIGSIAFGAQADSRLTAHEERLAAVERASQDSQQRLARMEQMAQDIQATTRRIEGKLDRRAP
jgi:hypothetical protein